MCYVIFDKIGLSGDHNKTTVIASLLLLPHFYKSNKLILALHTYGKVGLIDWQHCCFVNIISKFFGLKNLSQVNKNYELIKLHFLN